MYPSPQDVRISDHVQQLPTGLPVVVAPADSATVRATVSDLAAAGGLLERMADDPETVVVADCGRLDTGRLSPMVILADDVLLVVRPVPEEVGLLDVAVKALQTTGGRVRLVLRADGYGAAEMSRTLGVEVAGRLPEAPETGLFARGRQAAYAHAVHQIALSIANSAHKRSVASAVAPESVA